MHVAVHGQVADVVVVEDERHQVQRCGFRRHRVLEGARRHDEVLLRVRRHALLQRGADLRVCAQTFPEGPTASASSCDV
jgi:hypothetical protein